MLQAVGTKSEAGVVEIEAEVAEVEVIKILHKAVDVYLWRRIYNLVKTYVTEHPYFKTSRPTRSINENFQRLEFFYETFPRKIFQQIAAETNHYYAQSQQNISNKYTQYVAFTEAKLLAFFGVKSAID